MQELTAVMLESARKGMWKASEQQIREVAELHTKMVKEYEAGCSGFICDNSKLQEFISQKIDKKDIDNYKAAINAARQVQMDEQQSENSVVLKKEEQNKKENNQTSSIDKLDYKLFYVPIALVLALIVLFVYMRKKQ